MKVVTLTACSRTRELALVLDALEPQLGDWTLLVGVDGTNEGVRDLLRERQCWPIIWNDQPLGIENHQRELVKAALAMGATHVAGLQDDTVPRPGAVNFWNWASVIADVGLLAVPSMGLTASGGRAVYRPWVPSGVGAVRLGPVFAAEGFVASRRTLQRLLPHWNGPSDYLDGQGRRYTGWDWSLNSAMRRLALTSYAPAESLVENIGATGTNTQPELHALVHG